MRNEERREEGLRHTRISAEYKATYTLGDITGEGFITDISEGGVAMRTSQPFVVGDEPKISIKITDKLILEFTGVVRGIQGDILGIQIKEIDSEMKERFLSHINGIIRLMNRQRFETYELA